MIVERFGCIPFGGDYCPEQWDKATWKEDLRIMQEYGVNTVTINVHSWVMNQPTENVYDYAKLDQIVDMLTEAGIRIIMGTGTTAIPNWMGKKYPDMLMTDISGMQLTTGRREVYCTNSPDYRREIRSAAGHLAAHYKYNKNIKLWHMANEVGLVCYCDRCAGAYRTYLKKKFGTLEKLNKAWITDFWGHTYTDWEQIDPPRADTEYAPNINDIPNNNFHFRSTEAIEYLRFFSESLRECYEIEASAIREHIPDAIVTNNFQFRTLDYRRVCAASDVIAFDSYPEKNEHPSVSAMQYDICRNLLSPGKPFMIMEMTPSQASWAQTVPLKRPGDVELIAMRGLAHGADSSLFFQIRRNLSGFEKFHGAMIDHVGHEKTRTGREMKDLGGKLRKLEPYLSGTEVKAQAAVIMDFDTMFGVEIPCSIQKRVKYMEEVEYYYRYFNEHNIPVDVLPASADLSSYALVAAPMLYMLDRAFAEEIRQFVKRGGVFVCTYYSGLADLNDVIYPGGYPGVLKEVCGIWVEETDALTDQESNTVKTGEELGNQEFVCGFLCDLIHLEGARPLGEYTQDFYAGMPCLCENEYGKGRAVYIGSKLSRDGAEALMSYCCSLAGMKSLLETPSGVEACLREKDGEKLLFLLNNLVQDVDIPLPAGWETVLFGGELRDRSLHLPARRTAVLRQ